MNTISTTLAVDDNSVGIIAAMLGRFPKGKRVRVAVTEEGDELPAAISSGDFMLRLAEARKSAPVCPWETTEAAMAELREGDRD